MQKKTEWFRKKAEKKEISGNKSKKLRKCVQSFACFEIKVGRFDILKEEELSLEDRAFKTKNNINEENSLNYQWLLCYYVNVSECVIRGWTYYENYYYYFF